MSQEDPGGSPYVPHSPTEIRAMLDAIGVADVEALFDVPPGIRFDGDFGIDAGSEQAVRADLEGVLDRNDDLVAFLGRGHYAHYVPAVVDRLASRSEFLSSYTQYQPEVAQGFLQALFEYQSLLVELTGLGVANSSMYDAATALGEAALLAGRVTDGDRVLVPSHLRAERRSVLENYVSGADLRVESYPMEDGNVAVDALADALSDDVAFVYAESPTIRGVVEERLPAVADLAHDHGAVCGLGSDPIALSLLTPPGDVGVDVVVGDASVLGTGTAFGTGLGLFACRDDYLRDVPGRLVGASTDRDGRRAFTLTLQTREQHIRRERATSNICTNQAWLALRAAIHAAVLGPDGLVDLAERCVALPRGLAAELDALAGVQAPVHDRAHFREFVARVDQPAAAIATDLEAAGYAVHVVGEHELGVCVTDANAHAVDGFVDAVRGAV